jgi:hypothetical protein
MSQIYSNPKQCFVLGYFESWLTWLFSVMHFFGLATTNDLIRRFFQFTSSIVSYQVRLHSYLLPFNQIVIFSDAYRGEVEEYNFFLTYWFIYVPFFFLKQLNCFTN